jgi:hypothetical protein
LRQKGIDCLWKLRSHGIALRNRALQNKDEFTQWQTEYTVWRQNVLAAAEQVNINLMRWLDRLDRTHSIPENVQSFDPEHERLARIMSEILFRLQIFLEKEMFDVSR